MKKWLLLMVIGMVAFSTMAFTGSYKKLWAKYETSIDKGLPKTGIEILSEIQAKAKNKKDIGHYFKASYLKAEQSMSLGYRDTKQNIQDLEEWLEGADSPDQKAILSAILFSNYLNYFNNNRYKFSELTDIEASEKPFEDIDQWTVSQYQARINDLYDAIWVDPHFLLSKSAKDYIPFIEIYDFGKYFNHNLYHVLYTFTLNSLNNYPYGPGWRENLASDLRDSTIGLYEKNSDAILLLKLDGFVSVRNMSLDFNEKLSRIDELIEQNSNSELVVEAVAVKMNLLLAQPNDSTLNYPDLIQLAESYIKKYPKYVRIGILRDVIERIKAPVALLTIRRYAHTNENIITDLAYKNINKANINLYQWTGDSSQKLNKIQEQLNDEESSKDFLADNTKLIDEMRLSNIYTTDHKLVNDTTLNISTPTEGLYVIAFYADKSEGVSYQLVTVQNTTLIRQSSQNQNYDFFTVDILSGAPVEGVDIKLYPSSKENLSHKKQIANLFTDKNGRASWVVPENFAPQTYLSLLAQINGQIINDDNERVIYAQSKEQNPYSDKITYQLITDRRLYRPGQRVYVKGYIYQQDSISGKYRVVPNYKGVMNVYDNSSLAIGDFGFETNAFGSFTTEVQLPSSMLNGNVNLTVANQQGSQQTIMVEEYKRPTFTLSFLPIQGAYMSGDTITLRGKVESFSQSLLTKAKLEAEVSLYDYTQGKSRVIPSCFIQPRASDVSLRDGLVIDSEGDFSLEVLTLKNIQGSYQVKVKLVSADGETHEEQTSFWVSDAPYSVFTNLPAVVDLNTPLILDFTAQNSDGTSIEAKGEYKLFRQTQEYEKQEPILKGSFNTENKQTIDLSLLPVGSYILSIYRQDGKKSSSKYFQAFSKKEIAVPVDKGEWLYVEKNTFSKSEPAVVYFGAAEKDVYLFIDIYTLKGKIHSENILLDESYTKVELPYSQEYRSGAVVVFTYYKNHRLYTRRVSLTLDAKEENLSLSWLTFRDKINAGDKQEWILQVLDAQDRPATDVELLALMYDASLDELIPTYMSGKRRFYFNNVSLPSVDVYSSYRDYKNTINSKFRVDGNRKAIPEYSFDKFFFEQYRSKVMIRGISRAKASYGADDRQYNELSEAVITGAVNAAPQSVMTEVTNDAGSVSSSDVLPSIRSNFDETAFFKPTLSTHKDGKVKISFTSPEQLTKWNVQVYAHTKDMVVGYSDKIAFTERKFAILMNAPRFIRQGDEVTLSSILKNDLPQALQASAELILFDPITDKQIAKLKQAVRVKANSENTVSFELPMLGNRSEVGIRILATAGKHSDGEQYIIPILSNIEPFISGKSIVEIKPGEKNIDLRDLFGENSKAAQKKEVLVEFTSNPIWFAIDPILRTWVSTSTSALSLSNKLAVSSVAYELWESNPEFIKSFTKDSSFKNFDNNAQFRTILNQETPWAAMPAKQENTLSMFHEEIIKNTSQLQLRGYLDQLKALQTADGGFAWYEGMQASAYVTLPVVKNLFNFIHSVGTVQANASLAKEMINSAISYLYGELFKAKDIKDIAMPSVEQMQVVLLSLEQNVELSKDHKKQKELIFSLLSVVLKEGDLMQRALALELAVMGGDKKLANRFMFSLNEYLYETKDEGQHFGGTQFNNLSSSMQIDTHIAAMQALEKWQSNETLLNAMKFWLATKLSMERIYSEFTIGNAISALGMGVSTKKEIKSNESLTISLGSDKLTLDAKNPFVKQSVSVDGAVPMMRLTKEGNKVVWGRVIGKYYAPITEVKSSNSAICVDTKFYVEQVVGGKKELKAITDNTILQPGDVLVSRVDFQLDANMDFVQITDSRAGNLEPTITSSGYRWNCLLRGRVFMPSYVSLRDGSTQYFFYHLEKGSYILENRSFVVRGGTYQTGTVTIQSAYSPELSGYSGSQVIKSK